MFSGGSGTKEDPFIITDVTQLQAIKNNLQAHYVINNEIDASDTVNWRGGLGFEPIASENGDVFTGSLDGQGYPIKNLFLIHFSSVLFSGLFGTNEGVIKGVNLVDASFETGPWTGCIVGQNLGEVIDCSFSGTLQTNSPSGAIVGQNKGIVDGCYSLGHLFNQSIIGGIAGINEGTISNCYSEADVEGTSYAGGICGENQGSILSCYSKGATIKGNGLVGGLCGWNTNSGSVESSFSENHVIGNMSPTGGLVGICDGTVKNCYANSLVESLGGPTGGLCGVSSIPVENCYSVSVIGGVKNFVGGLLATGAPPISCYWNTDTADIDQLDDFGRTTAEMMQRETYIGWDFDDVWQISEGESYPQLRVFIVPSGGSVAKITTRTQSASRAIILPSLSTTERLGVVVDDRTNRVVIE